VGVIGLGVGTLAAYGEAGDEFTFFELNPQVVQIAETLFTYLRESKAKVSVLEGDGRLELAKTSRTFDVLVIDAFSGDSIPVHLLTKEALDLYIQHLAPGGAIAFHVSNDYLDLAPVVQKLAEARGFEAILVRNPANPDEMVYPSDWVLVTNNPSISKNPSIRMRMVDINSRPRARLWTDSYSSIFSVLKTPQWLRQN